MFDLGKTYKHNSGKFMTIIGALKTHTYGLCLIGETYFSELVPVGNDDGSFKNWREVSPPTIDDANAVIPLSVDD